ncbi:hypothetical protein NQZ68_016380 [Dissostichus eleginoides]|nr:hypothetical protein NQZ68_016380 [Dissostichus eleginoides]
MIDVTENESQESETIEEERYPAGIQPLTLPKPVCLAQVKDWTAVAGSQTGHRLGQDAWVIVKGGWVSPMFISQLVLHSEASRSHHSYRSFQDPSGYQRCLALK